MSLSVKLSGAFGVISVRLTSVHLKAHETTQLLEED